ncbi:MAG TPA: hypothetical protein VKG78_12740 [Opitutaceae bacterium]|nr:hypothetical protein [Opitutaceae bacterium]
MKSQIIGLKVASVLFMCAALVHASRLVFAWKVQVGEHTLSVGMSAAAAVFLAVVSVWLGSLACGHKADAASAPPPAPKA